MKQAIFSVLALAGCAAAVPQTSPEGPWFVLTVSVQRANGATISLSEGAYCGPLCRELLRTTVAGYRAAGDRILAADCVPAVVEMSRERAADIQT